MTQRTQTTQHEMEEARLAYQELARQHREEVTTPDVPVVEEEPVQEEAAVTEEPVEAAEEKAPAKKPRAPRKTKVAEETAEEPSTD